MKTMRLYQFNIYNVQTTQTQYWGDNLIEHKKNYENLRIFYNLDVIMLLFKERFKKLHIRKRERERERERETRRETRRETMTLNFEFDGISNRREELLRIPPLIV